MCYIFVTFQGRASFWGEPGQALAPVFPLSVLGGWPSGKGCWLPLRVKKPSVASLSPEELQVDCQGLRVIRRLENWAWEEVGTGLASEARRQGWQWPRGRNSLVQWSWLPRKGSLAVFRVLSSCPGFRFQGGSIQLASLCPGPSLYPTRLYP